MAKSREKISVYKDPVDEVDEAIFNGIKKVIHKSKTYIKKPENKRELAVDIPFAQELGLSAKDLMWIREVKESSMKAISERMAESRKKGQNPLTTNFTTVTAYDVVLVHLMMMHDIKRLGHDSISERTEKKIEDILMAFSLKFRSLSVPTKESEPDPFIALVMPPGLMSVLDGISRAKTAKDKAAIFSRVLNIVHKGGSNTLLEEVVIGLPQLPLEDTSPGSDSREFLERLERLGEGVRW